MLCDQFNRVKGRAIQVLYSDVLGLDPARVTHLYHRSSVCMDCTPFKVPLQRTMLDQYLKSLKSAAIGRLTAVRMLSFTEAYEPYIYRHTV